MSAVFKLVSARALYEFSALAEGKTVGHVRNSYFEEESFLVRYLVVDGERLKKSRHLLISPEAIERIDTDRKIVSLSLPLKRIEECPFIMADLPLERQYELALRQYYEWIPYWKRVGAPAPPYVPEQKPPQSAGESDITTSLHSVSAITGGEVDAHSGSIGTLTDILVDVGVWRIRFLEVALTKLDGERRILIPVEMTGAINWPNNTVMVRATDDMLKTAPSYQPGSPPSEKESQEICAHFGIQQP